MERSSPVASASTLVAMHRAYALLNDASYSAGDLNLTEYAFLLRASLGEQGVSMKELTREFSFVVSDAMALSRGIVQKELATLVRDPADRRCPALRVTGKGIVRLTLMDETMAVSLLESNDAITRELIEHLATYFPVLETPQVDTFVPAGFVLLLCRYRAALVHASTCVGLSTLHAVILLLADLSERGLSPDTVLRHLRIAESSLLLQLEYLEERRLLTENEDGALELTEEGIARVDSFMRKSGSVLHELVQSYPEEERVDLDELCKYCTYVFRQ